MKNIEKLTKQEIVKRLNLLKNWEFRENAITASFEFKDFKEAFGKMIQIAFEAETRQHHPKWTNSFNKLTISLSTHEANGVSEKDFSLAQAIDKIMGNR